VPTRCPPIPLAAPTQPLALRRSSTIPSLAPTQPSATGRLQAILRIRSTQLLVLARSLITPGSITLHWAPAPAPISRRAIPTSTSATLALMANRIPSASAQGGCKQEPLLPALTAHQSQVGRFSLMALGSL